MYFCVIVSGSPPGSEYGQDMPVLKPWEKTAGPPILPPHLLQVILNKDTPLSVSLSVTNHKSDPYARIHTLSMKTCIIVRAYPASGTKSRYVKSSLRAFNKRWCYGPQRNAPLPEKVRDDITLQTNIISSLRSTRSTLVILA